MIRLPWKPLGSLVLAVGGLAACGRAPLPRWTALAPLGERLVGSEAALTRHPWRSGHEVELFQDPTGAELRLHLSAEDWEPAGRRGLLHVPLVLFADTSADRLQLETPDGPLPRVLLGQLLEHPERGFNYSSKRGSLLLCGPGAPPESATLRCRIPVPAASDGARVRGRTFSGSVIGALPGVPTRCRVDVPPDSVLRFGTACEPLLGGIAPGVTRFRVRLDGEPLFEGSLAPGEVQPLSWHVAALPEGGRSGAELVFEADGPLAQRLFLDPRIGPRSVGRRGDRPWSDPRPDLVLFLADTFRADNMAAYGGAPGITPHLDRLAASGLCFLRAWSTAAWTLPAHASLFSGLYPPEVLAPGPLGSNALAASVDTVAERLARAGYRTAAFTDGGFVSSTYGLDQGFEVFAEVTENSKDLERQVAEASAFLAADDGRPTFLFVQTYRAHWPYLVSAATRDELGPRLGIEGQAQEVFEEIVAEGRALGGEPLEDVASMEHLPQSVRMVELAGRMRAHYQGAAADLDRGVGAFLEALRANGVLENGFLVFTSDHGEGFAEHGSLFHTAAPFEEQVRVPLLIAGRALPGARRLDPASLIDLAPTLAEMAGIPADPRWSGRSLISGEPEAARESRPLLAFESSRDPKDSMCVLQEGKKILVRLGDLPEGSLLGAYDLERDPGEQNDASAAAWAPALLREHTPWVLQVLAATPEGAPAELDDAKQAELRALGY